MSKMVFASLCISAASMRRDEAESLSAGSRYLSAAVTRVSQKCHGFSRASGREQP